MKNLAYNIERDHLSEVLNSIRGNVLFFQAWRPITYMIMESETQKSLFGTVPQRRSMYPLPESLRDI